MYAFVERVVSFLKRVVPEPVVEVLRSPYHALLSFLSSLYYGFPATKLTLIGVTGTKGKSTVTEMIYNTLTHAGYKTAVASTIRFAVGEDSHPNLFKMTLPGRGFIQKFLREAVDAGCTHAVVEISSESTKQFRHWFLFQNALVFTNLQKEHIEAHGSFEKYARAKLKIGKALIASSKRPRAIIANTDDPRSEPYLELPIEKKYPFSYKDATDIELRDGAVSFTYKHVRFSLHLPGSFSVKNALAVIRVGEFLRIPLETVAHALASIERIPGRTERIDEGQNFTVVVDYAHTPDSLSALYDAYPSEKICVLGNTGGGRDQWKRPEMGRIADERCKTVILTNEDPYDEDPHAIVNAMAKGMKRSPTIIMDRREAIAHALKEAQAGENVLITGKGTDPYIMEAHGQKTSWSDAQVVKEELHKLLQ